MLVRHFSENTCGRDFVVGDIHGAFSLVESGKAAVNFDPSRDRLFCVGDLIDRGADSHLVLDFLRQPYVHSVRGNHDHDFIGLNLPELRALGGINFNGLGWVTSLSDDVLLAIQAALADLPAVIEIETGRGRVGVVHADVPRGMSWGRFIELIRQGDAATLQTALWGRDRLEGNDLSGVAGIDRLFVGHTVQPDGARRYGNVFAIDTGAVFHQIRPTSGMHLSMVNILSSTSSLVPPPQGVLRGSRVVDEAAFSPFGYHSGCSARAA